MAKDNLANTALIDAKILVKQGRLTCEEIPNDGPSARLREALVLLAARLVRDLHLGQVDSLIYHQLDGVIHGFCRQEARPREDPGEIHMEEAENVGARVDNCHAGVVGGQNQVGAVGGNCGKDTEWERWILSSRCSFSYIMSNTFGIKNSKVDGQFLQ